MLNGHAADILLVDDNPADVRLTLEAFKEGKLVNHVRVVENGVEAMELLHRQGKYADAARPDLVLLDLNMPKKDGREVLQEIKNDPELKRIPIIILTTSKAEEDVVRSYDSHVNCYVQKPVDYNEFTKVLRLIENFWFTAVVLPVNGYRK